jgi:hypothetical protein
MEECVICKKNIGNQNNCITECNHKYCLKCLLEHLKRNNSCPLCREKIIEEPLESSSESSESEADTTNEPEVIEIKSFEYYGKISVNSNLKNIFILTLIMFQTNVILCIITLFH